MESQGRRAAWHQDMWGQGGGGDGEQGLGNISQLPQGSVRQDSQNWLTVVLVLGPQQTDLPEAGREEQGAGWDVWKSCLEAEHREVGVAEGRK